MFSIYTMIAVFVLGMCAGAIIELSASIRDLRKQINE